MIELDVKVGLLIIVLIIVEGVVRKYKIKFNEWIMFVPFSLFSFSTISLTLHKDALITDYTIFIVSILCKALLFTALYAMARRLYYTLPQDNQLRFFYEYVIVALLLVIVISITQGSQLMNWLTIDQETGQEITIINHQGIAAFMELGLAVLGIYIIIRNWLFLRKGN